MFRALCCCLDDDDDDDDDDRATRDANERRRRDRDALGGVIADEDDVGTRTTTDGSLRRMMIVDGDDDDEGGGDDADEDGDRLLPRASRRSDTDGAFFRDEARAAAATALERSESAPPRGAKVSLSDGDLVVGGEDGKEEAMRRWVSETERRMETHRRAASAGFAGAGRAARDATRTKDDSRTAARRSETVDYDNSCPTCFEAYEEENPRITLGCGHHFHLACILSWQEYSAATHPSRESGCPACDAPIEFKEAL